MFHAMRRTKIICTIGPAVDDPRRISALVEAGMDVARLNFSHGTADDHRRYAGMVRDAAEDAGRHVAIMQDLQGPRIRTAELRDEIVLTPGQTITIGGPDSALPLTVPDVVGRMDPGERVLIDGGQIELVVEERVGGQVICRVVRGGPVRSRRGVNLPDSDLDLPALTPKDLEDLRHGVDMGVDMVAISFVRDADDVLRLRDELAEMGSDAWVVAKIERAAALDAVDDILTAAVGIMIARGDLGVEMPPERVPVIQKALIGRAHARSRVVITATQMLESMVEHPTPTRAEVSDVANAILDGTDAIMLSEETAAGSHPVEAVRTMDRIAREIEGTMADDLTFRPSGEVAVKEAISHSACVLATHLDTACIVAFTGSGSTARRISKYRHGVPVHGFTPDPGVARRLSVLWGVHPHVVDRATTADELFDVTERRLLEGEFALSGDLVIIVAGLPVGTPGTTNLVKAHRIP